MYHGACAEIRGQLEGLLLSCGCQGRNTGYQTWWQVLLPARLCQRPLLVYITTVFTQNSLPEEKMFQYWFICLLAK